MEKQFLETWYTLTCYKLAFHINWFSFSNGIAVEPVFNSILTKLWLLLLSVSESTAHEFSKAISTFNALPIEVTIQVSYIMHYICGYHGQQLLHLYQNPSLTAHETKCVSNHWFSLIWNNIE